MTKDKVIFSWIICVFLIASIILYELDMTPLIFILLIFTGAIALGVPNKQADKVHWYIFLKRILILSFVFIITILNIFIKVFEGGPITLILLNSGTIFLFIGIRKFLKKSFSIK